MSASDDTANLGAVVSVRGSVVDVHFDRQLPAVYSLLRAGADEQIVIEVLSQRDAHRVRGIALTPTQGLARGMPVRDTGGPLKAPVGTACSRGCSMCSATDRSRTRSDRSRMAPRTSVATPAVTPLHQSEIFETGIKLSTCWCRSRGAERRAVRRRGRRQNRAADRNDPQHDRPSRGRQRFLRHWRALPRGRGALPGHEESRCVAEHGHGFRTDE